MSGTSRVVDRKLIRKVTYASGAQELIPDIDSLIEVTTQVKITTVDYTLLSSDNVVIFNGSNLTATIPAGVSGKEYTIKNINSTSLTIDADASETIDGELTVEINVNDSLQILFDGSNWIIT